MCGIAGYVRWDGGPVATDTVSAMCSVLVHRGPDDLGLLVADGAGLAMRRLSIIDLVTGRQPVWNEDGTIAVVLNGEIYNYKELRRDLEQRGHQLATAGDTEVIVHLYEDYGPDLVKFLRGMFAFAVWDTRQRVLMLARDRIGIKPLYYARTRHGLAFASEVKALLQLPDIERRLSWSAVGHLFSFLSTPPTQSIVEGVHKLEPAHRAVLSHDGTLRIDRYWDVRFTGDSQGSVLQLADELRERLAEAMTLHLRSDVPIGVFLSGGVDSSAVLATMATLGASAVKSFSIGFADADYNELAAARAVAGAFGTDHHELVLEPTSLDLIDDLTWYLDEPFGDSSALATFMVARLAADHVKVVLSGDGGDELFAGYDKYVVERRERVRDRLPLSVRRILGSVGAAMPDGALGRRFLCHLALDGPRRYLDAALLFRGADQDRLFQPDVAKAIAAADPLATPLGELQRGDGWLSAAQLWDLHHYLPLDVLTKVDRMTMAHSIEARPVLLDHPFVEFAATVPEAWRLRGTTTKYLLKHAMRGRLPDSILDRPKHGFAVPLAAWFRDEWHDFIRDVLLSDTCRQRSILNLRHVEHVLRLHEDGRPMDLQLWTMLSFELWCRMFLDRGLGAGHRPVQAA